MGKMKIGMVTPWGKTTRCGIRTYSENLINSLVKHGVEVYVIRLPRFGILTPEILQNIVDKIPSEIDLLHIQEEYGLYKNLEGGFYGALNKLDIPKVTTMHAVGNFDVDPIVASVSDKVIVHNKFCFKKFGFPDKTVILPHGCKLGESVNRSEARKRLGLPEDIPIVGYLGFISRYKGLEALIQAVSKIPNIALLIGGGYHVEPGTSYIDRLKQWSLSLLSGRVQWLGYIPDDELKYVYSAMDILSYPSRYVTESGALLTALGYGKACITSNVPPFKEKERRKALVTFKDVDDLVDKIRYFLENNVERESLEGHALKYCVRNSWDAIARKHIKLYREFI